MTHSMVALCNNQRFFLPRRTTTTFFYHNVFRRGVDLLWKPLHVTDHLNAQPHPKPGPPLGPDKTSDPGDINATHAPGGGERVRTEWHRVRESMSSMRGSINLEGTPIGGDPCRVMAVYDTCWLMHHEAEHSSL